MKRFAYSSLIFVLVGYHSHAQKYKAVESEVTFFSSAPMEDIEAVNSKGAGIINVEKKTFAFAVIIRDFQFEKGLMQQHFNEKYMESDKYPKATFQGKIENFNPDNKDKQEVVADGELTIHGISQQVKIPSVIEWSGDKFKVSSVFNVKLIDYNIERPKLLWENIAEVIEVKVNFLFEPKEE